MGGGRKDQSGLRLELFPNTIHPRENTRRGDKNNGFDVGGKKCMQSSKDHSNPDRYFQNNLDRNTTCSELKKKVGSAERGEGVSKDRPRGSASE